MTRFEALEVFDQMQRLHPDLLPVPEEEWGHWQTPLLCAASAAMSGMLESSNTVGELIEACQHGITLLSAGILGQDEFAEEIAAVSDEIPPDQMLAR